MELSCPSLDALPYGIFSKELHERVGDQRIPIGGSIELTMRCNLRCGHCYLPFSQRAASGKGELTRGEFQRIFSEIADAGCLWLLLTGGEPLLQSDFLDIYDDAKKMGFIITLFTNGTLLNEAIVDHLAEYRPFGIEISLYGATQETYERVTGIPGSFARCMRGIELILEHDLPLKLKTVLINTNQGELENLQRLSVSLGVRFAYDPIIQAGIDGSLLPTQFRLSPEEIIAIDQQDPARFKAIEETYLKQLERKIDDQLLYHCGAGRLGFHVDAYGKMSLCMTARHPSYDLRTGSFEEGWGEFFPTILSLEHTPDFACAGCELRTICAQCPAVGWIEKGDPQGRVAYYCQLAHQRHAAFGPSLQNLAKVANFS
jgi:radical SAM protein with 4Fe4S-binding SPASM domain